MISIYDLYWAAGFLEGEGSFHDSPTQTGIRVTTAQVEFAPIEKLQNLFKGSHIRLVRHERPEHSPIWHWTLTGPRAAGLMMTLYPLLSPKRQAQIEKALASWKQRGWKRGKVWKEIMCTS